MSNEVDDIRGLVARQAQAQAQAQAELERAQARGLYNLTNALAHMVWVNGEAMRILEQALMRGLADRAAATSAGRGEE